MAIVILTSFIIVLCVILKRRQASKWSKLIVPVNLVRVFTMVVLWQRRWNRILIGSAGVRDCEAANYPHKTSTCEGQELGELKPP